MNDAAQVDYTVRVHVERTGKRGDDAARLRYDLGDAVPGSERYPAATLQTRAISKLVSEANAYYYVDDPGVSAPEREGRLERLGRDLYNLLDTSQGLLTGFLRSHRGRGLIVIALRVSENFAHLPWELMHDGNEFLAAAPNPVVPVRVVPQTPAPSAPQARALRVLFMACVPASSPYELDYQAEEAAIVRVASAETLPLRLVDEPTGNLDELECRLGQYPAAYFDIIHITGHAAMTGRSASFITETRSGGAHSADARQIGEAVQDARPRVIVLSGCRTAESGDLGSVASLAEELARTSAPAVIGWGRPVIDDDATQATAELYRQLMRGRTPARALAAAYRRLLRNDRPHWHCLRMFVQDGPARAPVTAVSDMTDDYVSFDRAKETTPHGLPKVDIGEFVGRRRETQELLRLLDPGRNSDRLAQSCTEPEPPPDAQHTTRTTHPHRLDGAVPRRARAARPCSTCCCPSTSSSASSPWHRCSTSPTRSSSRRTRRCCS